MKDETKDNVIVETCRRHGVTLADFFLSRTETATTARIYVVKELARHGCNDREIAVAIGRTRQGVQMLRNNDKKRVIFDG